MEQLCLVSALAVGHSFTLYSYTPDELKGVPDGVEVRDAREIMPEKSLVRYSDTNAVALGSNFFRYALLARDVGYWVDMDLHFLKPLKFAETYVFGWEEGGTINNAIMRIPAKSDMTRKLCDLPKTNRRPPWYGPKRSLLYYLRRLKEGHVRPEDLPWGTYSAGMLTYLAKKYGVSEQAQKPPVFYPVSSQEACLLYGPANFVEKLIKPETCTVHLWHSAQFKFFDKPLSRGSYLDVVCRYYDVEIKSNEA
jgi:hypothetical protein